MRKVSFALLLTLVMAAGAWAAYPEKPVEIVVTFKPGGGTDILGRTMGQFAEKYFGQSFAVVNKPGASGTIGWTSVAKTAKPDGYTITVISPPSFLMHPILRPATKFRIDDFDFIANVVMDPGIIAVRADSPWNSLADLMAAAAKEPKAVSFGYSGPGTAEALLLGQLERHGKVEFNKIPFDGSAPSVVALMGKHVDAVMMNVSESTTYVQDGNLKVIGVGSPVRSSFMPDVPTLKEQGYPFNQVTLRGFAAPKGLPRDVLDKLAGAFKQAFDDPEFQKKAQDLQMPLHFMGPDEYSAFLHEMSDTLKREWETNPW